MGPVCEASGLRWWDEKLLQTQVSFRSSFFPALLCVCDPQSLPSELSREELRVVTQYCISPDANQSDQVTRDDFRRFLARFGPLELSLSKLVACFCVNRELVPWFHGEIGRHEAEQVLGARERSDEAFLVRFSESHPTKFTLTYLKVHTASSNTPGRRELKNCLVRNLGEPGYALSEAVRCSGSANGSVRQRTYPSIGAFIQSSSNRLKYGVASNFALKCNQELAAVRAMQDNQRDSYSAFSTESFGKPEAPPDAASMLFSRSPPSQTSFLGTAAFSLNGNYQVDANSDSYASFSVESLAPPTIHHVDTPEKTALPGSINEDKSAPGSWSDRKFASSSSDYGNFASFAQRQPEEEIQPVAATLTGNANTPLQNLHRSPAASISDDYAAFASLASTFAHESQELAARGQQTISLSRSPVSAASSRRQGFDVNGYGSFASLAVTKPASSTLVGDTHSSGHLHVDNSIRSLPADSDYGSFASMANDLEDKIPQREQASAPPPPPMAVKSNGTSPSSDDIYGNFASLPLADKGACTEVKVPPNASLDHPPTRVTPASAPNSDVYGTFDATVSIPAVKTTPTTSALDELNIGMEFYKQKRLDDAVLRFILAQELARSTGDQVVEARALGNLGTVYLDKKNPQQAVRCYQQCLDITRAIEDTKRERTILNNLVLALVASEDLERALACCQVQLETTTNAINRRKIISRMSLLREKLARQTSS